MSSTCARSPAAVARSRGRASPSSRRVGDVIARAASRHGTHDDCAPARRRRRDVLFTSLVAVLAAAPANEARAGAVLDGLVKYRDDAKKALDADPEDEVLRGQLNFFDKQVERTRANAEFLTNEVKPNVVAGKTNYLGGLSFAVKDVQAEVDFWTKALGARVTSDVGSGDERVTTLAYGQISLSEDDGGKATVEIRQATSGADVVDVGNVLSYVAVTVPFGLRVSQIYESGGELLYGFGFFDMRSPGGIPVRGQVATRRDPLEVVALNVKNVREAEKFLVAEYGFESVKPLDANSYAPKSPNGSRLLYFTSPTKTFTVILQPWREKTPLRLGDTLQGVVVARGGDFARADVVADPRVAGVPFQSRPLAPEFI